MSIAFDDNKSIVGSPWCLSALRATILMCRAFHHNMPLCLWRTGARCYRSKNFIWGGEGGGRLQKV